MDKCVRIIVAIAISNHLTTGLTYKGYTIDAHKNIHHGFEHPDPYNWHDGRPDWDSKAEYRYPRTFHSSDLEWQKDSHHHDHDTDDVMYWRLHHAAGCDHSPINNNPNPKSWSSGQPASGWSAGQHGSAWPNRHHWPSLHHGSSWHNGQHTSESNPGRYWNNNVRPSAWDNRGRPVTRGPVTTTMASETTVNPRQGVTQSPFTIAMCIRGCPVTSEYSPVCGSNNITYGNAGRLECAQNCGVDVALQRNTACSVPAISNSASQGQTTQSPASSSSTMKDVPPTRFTTVEVPPTGNKEPPITISPEILGSIFTTQSPDDNYDIDIRTRSKFITQYVYPVNV